MRNAILTCIVLILVLAVGSFTAWIAYHRVYKAGWQDGIAFQRKTLAMVCEQIEQPDLVIGCPLDTQGDAQR